MKVKSQEREERTSEREKERMIADLTKALNEVKELRGLLPICAHCKKVREDTGYWKQIEDYITVRSDVSFSHAICPECLEKYYSDLYDENVEED